MPPDILGRAYEFLIKKFADDAGAKAGELFTPPEVVDTLVRILPPHPGDSVYDIVSVAHHGAAVERAVAGGSAWPLLANHVVAERVAQVDDDAFLAGEVLGGLPGLIGRREAEVVIAGGK